jgi:hypothetical protein
LRAISYECGSPRKDHIVTRVIILMAACCLSGAVAGYGMYTVEIPAYSLLVKSGSTNVRDIVGVFPTSTRLMIGDERLTNTDLLPYWRWDSRSSEMSSFSATA